jgi:O-antigen ligase
MTISLLKVPLLLLAFVPLLFYSRVLFPFIFPKVVFIRLMLAIFWMGFMIFTLAKPRKASLTLMKSLPRLKHPIFIAMAAYLLIMAVSTALAVNSYRAFWGDVERGEGLTGFLFFFGFFIATLLFFEKADWKRFFVLTVIAAAVLFFDQLTIFLAKTSLFISIDPVEIALGRAAGSLVGNPTFLSAFYIFAIFAAAMLLIGRVEAGPMLRDYFELFKRIALVAIILASTAGIFIGGTRGAILGLAIGVAALTMFVVLRREFSPGFRRLAGAGMAAGIVFIMIFISTRHASLWKAVPGFAKIAAFSSEDVTFRTRLISAGIGLSAINPKNEGILRALIGWGPENFSVAYQRHFDPRYFRYEALWFDRAHNKLLDVLVMNGFAGLIAYLTMWFFVFKTLIADRKRIAADKNQRAALLFFGVAYFVQNLFAFENISNYIPFFTFLAYLVSQEASEVADKNGLNADKRGKLSSEKSNSRGDFQVAAVFQFVAGAMTVFFLSILIVTFVSLRQMLLYFLPLAAGRPDVVISNFDRITKPYTYVQMELRSSFGQTLLTNLSGADINAIRPFLSRVAESVREATDRERTNARPFILTASFYEMLGDRIVAQEYRRKALELAPRRQDLLYFLALAEAQSGNPDAALDYAKRMRDADPEATISRIYYAAILMLTKQTAAFDEVSDLILSVFKGKRPFIAVKDEVIVARQIFRAYLEEFYRLRDRERYLETLRKFEAFEKNYESASRFPSQILPEILRRQEALETEGWSAIEKIGPAPELFQSRKP